MQIENKFLTSLYLLIRLTISRCRLNCKITITWSRIDHFAELFDIYVLLGRRFQLNHVNISLPIAILATSCSIGIATSFSGMYASFYFNSASGATIVLFGSAAAGICALYSFLFKIRHTHYHGDTKHSHAHVHTGTQKHSHENDGWLPY